MADRKVLCIGDSVSAGSFCTSPEFTYQAHLFRLLRQAMPQHTFHEMAPPPGGSSARMGGIWAKWDKQFRHLQPDVIVLGGIGDNDGSSAVASIATAISMESENIIFDANVTANRAYIITDGTDSEVVIPQTVSTVTGTRCLRGCMGTTPRSWPKDSEVLTWDDRSDDAWAQIIEYILLDMMPQSGKQPIILIGGQVFESLTGLGNTATSALVADLQKTYPGLEYCPYATSDGTSLFAASAYTDYSGPAAILAEDMSDSATTFECVDATDIDPGDYVMLVQTAQTSWATKNAAPTYSVSEIMQVVSKNGNVVTVEAGSERAKLGSSSTNLAFTTGDRVCKMATTRIDPRYSWNGLGASGTFVAEGWGYDAHPNNRGYLEIGKAFFRGFLRAITRTQGGLRAGDVPIF